jgi:NAD(P)-dependent dehydrogenase (short-subunit alcohol dehydrogenase family)
MTMGLGSGLEGKVAIVTGGGADADGIGNGRASAMLLAEGGARVLVVDRSIERAERTVAMIAENGGEALALVADVSDDAGARKIAQTAHDRWGRLDILNNNVGIGSRGSVVEQSEQGWDQVMRVNVTSMFLCSKYAIPLMENSGGGAIVNISSISALRPRGLTAYSTSKGAVIALTRAMAVDHGPAGVRVNCIAPGPMFTPMVNQGGMTAQARANRREASVLGIEGTGWDIGHAVCYLCSERARYVTGQVLVVDGGATMRGPERESAD